MLGLSSLLAGYRTAMRSPANSDASILRRLGAVLHQCWATLLYKRLPDHRHVAPLQGLVVEDPFAQLPVGTMIAVEPIPFTTSNAVAVPQGVTNWTFFEGAMLMVVVRSAEEELVVGTGVIVAPGLAI